MCVIPKSEKNVHDIIFYETLVRLMSAELYIYNGQKGSNIFDICSSDQEVFFLESPHNFFGPFSFTRSLCHALNLITMRIMVSIQTLHPVFVCITSILSEMSPSFAT